jgi:hypothetical protein
MTNPTPEAIEAVADALRGDHICSRCRKPLATQSDYDTYGEGEGEHLCWSAWEYDECPEPLEASELWEGLASDALVFIRDAIHRYGPDADAIRDALGLATETRSRATSVDAGLCNSTCGLVICGPSHRRTRIKFGDYRRVIGEWQEVQP